MKYKKISSAIASILVFLLCFSLDYKLMGDIFRLGKQRILFVLAPLFIPFVLPGQLFPALLLSYSLALWAHKNFLLYSVLDVAVLGMCILVTQFLLRAAPREKVIKYFVYAAAIQAGYGILQVMGVQLLYSVPEPFFQGKPLAFMGQHTVLGCFLAACLAPALWLGMPLASCTIIICAMLTGSSTTYASLWAVFSLYGLYKKCIKTCIFMQASLGISALVYWLIVPQAEIFNLQQRPRLWAEGWKAFKANPIFGGGPGFWAGEWQPQNMPLIDGFRPNLLHSELVTLLVEYGLVGLTIFLVGLYVFTKNFKLTWHHAVCVAILVNGLANFPLHIVPIGVLFLLCLGYSMNKNFNQKEF